ncbi:wax ester/triacylglycerol synthase domain-containing protein [Streptomyces lancefieldiae]|uniref:diacylglycerol O-acyltransferase n=1 Tax=Streptomyces lancefieldiae TaxID=3075520 RepID=A0ABU3ALK4_9ACTN|nr:wax ester/triacylglycerol synthase domain-containing protein [Streptomyces sp. DSM 40712]MDT0611074.1 wax ester/triacylglycerol synthase family O-acyltransferase [Streptomyces sp. DSM 40712]
MAQTHPSVSQTIGVILHLEGAAPTLGELRSHVASHLEHEPRLTHYLHGPGLQARWHHDPAPDLDHRVRAQHLPSGDQRLETALTDLVARPLPDTGPLWDIWLLAGYAPGRYCICLRAHHSTQDGMGLIGTLTTLFGTAPASTTQPAPTVQPAPRAGAGAYLGTVRNMLSACATHHVWNDTALPLTGHRDIGWAQVPTQRLRNAATARGGDTNDGFLAALGGALRTWTSQSWRRGADRPLPAITMVNLRRAEELERPGNYFTFAPAPLPCHEPTAAGRLDHVIAVSRTTKDPSHHKAMRSVMDLVPARAFQALAARMTTPGRSAITTSYLAVHRPLRYGQDPVTSLQPFSWLPRHQPATIVACSYNGITSVNFVTDAALPGLRRLPSLFHEAVDGLPQPHDDPQVPGLPPRTGSALAPPAADRDTTGVIDFALIKDILVQQGHLPATPITPGATQAQAGIDSLAVALLSMTLEDRMGIVIPEHELAEAPTVADLVSLVAGRAAAPSDPEDPAERGPHSRTDRVPGVPEV